MKEYCISYKLKYLADEGYYTDLTGNKFELPGFAGMIIEKLRETEIAIDLSIILNNMAALGEFEYINIRPANEN